MSKNGEIGVTRAGWLASYGFSLVVIVLMHTTSLASPCGYGWCQGPPPLVCPEWCGTVTTTQSVYYSPDCYPFSVTCSHKICWYLNNDGGTSCECPWNVCDNSDVWECLSDW